MRLGARRWKVSDYVDRIVIFPRYTTFVGNASLVSQVFDARAWTKAIFLGGQGAGIGGTPATLQFTLQVSADLENWLDAVTFPSSPAPGEFEQIDVLVYPWMRVKAVVTGADPAISAWLVADMVRRTDEGAEDAA